MRLTKNELKFVKLAANLPEAVFDFENGSRKDFINTYGLTPKQAVKMVDKLELKVTAELNRRTLKQTK